MKSGDESKLEPVVVVDSWPESQSGAKLSPNSGGGGGRSRSRCQGGSLAFTRADDEDHDESSLSCVRVEPSR